MGGRDVPRFDFAQRPEPVEGPERLCFAAAALQIPASFLVYRRGLPADSETCPQYLFLSLENFDVPGFEGAEYVFTPPLGEKWHQDKLWAGLAADHLQVVSTDHCPFCHKDQKELGKDDFTKIPNGGPGIEHRLSLVSTGGVHRGRFSANRFVELVSTAPGKLFRLYPRKGTIAMGSDADLVIFDPNEEQLISAKTHHMRVDYSMFEGMRIKGVPKQVLLRGRMVIDENKFAGRPGRGEFLKRQTYNSSGGLPQRSARGYQSHLAQGHRGAPHYGGDSENKRVLPRWQVDFTERLRPEISPRSRPFHGSREFGAVLNTHRKQAALVCGRTPIHHFHCVATRLRQIQRPGHIVLGIGPGINVADLVAGPLHVIPRGLAVNLGVRRLQPKASIRFRFGHGPRLDDPGRPGQTQFDHCRGGIKLLRLADGKSLGPARLTAGRLSHL